MRRTLALLLALVMCFALLGTTAVAEAPAAQAGDVVILYTNDVHTYISNPISYDVIAGVKAELEKTYDTVILADAGDHIQGTAYGSMDKGKTIIDLMNAAGYDIATLGNHEFDYDQDGRIAVTDEWANFPYVSCNFYAEENGVRGVNVLDSFVLFQAGDASIAIVGVTSPESFTKSTPAYFMNEEGNYIYGISGGDNGAILAADVQAAVDVAKAVGATKVILLAHLGDDLSSSPWTSYELIAGISGVDALIDGHAHSRIEGDLVADKDGKDVLLTSTGEYFKNIGMMIIHADGTIESDLISAEAIEETVKDENGNPVLDKDGNETTEVVGYRLVSDLYTGEAWPVDETVAAIKNDWMAAIDEQLGEVIGTTELCFNNYDADGNRLVRSTETNSGDLAADALYFLFDNMGLDVDIAIMNGGGIRNKAVTGDFTYKTAKEIHTFGNVACLQTITGQQLLDALEWGARTAGTFNEEGKALELGAFLQVAGITYQIDASWPTSVQADEKGVWIGAPTGGYRVSNVMVYNKETGAYEPLDLEAEYNLAGYNYTLRDLGDGFNMFSSAVNVLDYVMEDYMVIANYVKSFEDGVVAADNSPLLAKYPGMLIDYSEITGAGRIVIENIAG